MHRRKENGSSKKNLYDITTFGEILIDFTWQGVNEEGQALFARKPGADTQIQKEEIDNDILDRTNIFHVGSLSLTDQPARDTTHDAIRRAKERGNTSYAVTRTGCRKDGTISYESENKWSTVFYD